MAVRSPQEVANLTVLFDRPPAPAEVTRILVAELREVLRRESTPRAMSAYARVGPEPDGLAEQMRGSNGRYLSVHFDPDSGEIRDQDDCLLWPVGVLEARMAVRSSRRR